MKKTIRTTAMLICLSFSLNSLAAQYQWEQQESSSQSKHRHENGAGIHDHGKKRMKPMGVTIVAQVDGMVCDFCARGLEKGFSKKREVENTIVSLEQGTVTIRMKGDRMLSDEEITTIIEDNGMTVRSIDHGSGSARDKMMPKDEHKGMHKEQVKAKKSKTNKSEDKAEAADEEGSGFGWW